MQDNILSGPRLEPFPAKGTLGQVLFEKLKKQPPGLVLIEEVDTRQSITSSEYLLAGIRVANGLKNLGVQPGQVVALCAESGIDVYSAILGSLFQGVAVAPVDPSLTIYELQNMFKMLNPVLIFCGHKHVQTMSAAISKLENQVPFVTFEGPKEDSTNIRFEDLLQTPGNVQSFAPTSTGDNESLCFIMPSSGTTGPPKGIMLTDKGFLFQIQTWRYYFDKFDLRGTPLLQPSFVFWVTALMFFAAATSEGVKRVLMKNSSLECILRAIQDIKIGWILTSSPRLSEMHSYPEIDKYDLSSLKLVLIGGSPAHPSWIQSLQKRLSAGAGVVPCYGLTELSGTATIQDVGEDITSVGRLSPEVQMKIVDSEGKSLGPGEDGEICFKIPSIMKGYLNNEESTRAAIDADGWFHTGDIGRYNDQEMVYISGRVKEIFKYKDRQISPSELEIMIHSIPGVVDVGVAALKVDACSSCPIAFVVKEIDSKVTKEEIHKCIDENLSDHKRLRGGIHFVEKIPRTPTGKIKRAELAKLVDLLQTKDT